MKTASVIFGIIIAGAALAAIQRHSVIEELRERNASLKTRTEDLAELKNEVERLRSIEIDTNALEALRGETMELMRLRAKVSRLRPIADKPDAELQNEIRQSKSEIEKAKADFDHEAKWIVEDRISRLKQGIARVICDDIEENITEYGRFPHSLESFRQSVSEALNQPWFRRMKTTSLSPEYLAQIDARLEDFELLTPPEDFASTDKPYLFLREKTPRKLLNGNLQRIYGCARTVRGERRFWTTVADPEDGDFEQWEKDFLNRYTPSQK